MVIEAEGENEYLGYILKLSRGFCCKWCNVDSEGTKSRDFCIVSETFYSPGTSRDHNCKVSRCPGTVPPGHETSRDQGQSCPGTSRAQA